MGCRRCRREQDWGARRAARPTADLVRVLIHEIMALLGAGSHSLRSTHLGYLGHVMAGAPSPETAWHSLPGIKLSRRQRHGDRARGHSRPPSSALEAAYGPGAEPAGHLPRPGDRGQPEQGVAGELAGINRRNRAWPALTWRRRDLPPGIPPAAVSQHRAFFSYPGAISRPGRGYLPGCLASGDHGRAAR